MSPVEEDRKAWDVLNQIKEATGEDIGKGLSARASMMLSRAIARTGYNDGYKAGFAAAEKKYSDRILDGTLKARLQLVLD